MTLISIKYPIHFEILLLAKYQVKMVIKGLNKIMADLINSSKDRLFKE